MRLFILAAGKGERLWPLTRNSPKSLIDLGNGTTILENQIEAAIESELYEQVVIVTGYRAAQIDARILEYRSKIDVRTLFNPFYDVSNNLISLWVASHLMIDRDFLITNGDNVYEPGVFAKIKTDKTETIQLTIDRKLAYDEDDMKVSLDDEGRVRKVSKGIPPQETSAESVGLALVRGERSRRLMTRKIHEMVRDKQSLSMFWLEVGVGGSQSYRDG